MLTKTLYFFLVLPLALSLSGCATNGAVPDNADGLVQWAIEHDKDALAAPVSHEVYHYDGLTDADVIAVYNTLGDISIKQSKDNQVHAVVNLVQTKTIKDFDAKLNNLQIIPQNMNGILFYEPLYRDGVTNYWKWIDDKLNANGIKIDFELQIPQTVQEIRLFNDIGNISLNDVTAKVYAQTDTGSIKGENITPLDTAVFKTDSPLGNDKTGIDLNFSSLDYANEITAGVSAYNMVLTVPKGAQFIHETDSNLVAGYDKSIVSRFDYCEEMCLQKATPIQPKRGETVIKTTAENESNMVSIKHG